jgi:hypothetical protein
MEWRWPGLIVRSHAWKVETKVAALLSPLAGGVSGVTSPPEAGESRRASCVVRRASCVVRVASPAVG